MNLLLVDDEPMVLRLLEVRVLQVLPKAACNSFSSAIEAMNFAESNRVDIAFLDINMRVMSGIDMAKRLQELYPEINIIFCTAYTEYMGEAFDMYCSGYLMKPITAEKIKTAIEHLRYPVHDDIIKFKCFGNFEVYFKNEPISFKYKKTKEMLAYLVDRNGADVSSNEIMAVIFEDDDKKSYFRNLIVDLTKTFESIGKPEIIRHSRGMLGIERDMVKCDYFDYLDGKNSEFLGEYMTQYSFSEFTVESLKNKI